MAEELWRRLRDPRITSLTESAVAIDIIQQARLRKSRELHKRRHTDYATEFYGTVTDKEKKRQTIREMLKLQMKQQDDAWRQQLRKGVAESVAASEKDRKHLEKDLRQNQQRFTYLRQFRDGNKTIMELKAEQRRINRQKEHAAEREMLLHSPINWNKTLS